MHKTITLFCSFTCKHDPNTQSSHSNSTLVSMTQTHIPHIQIPQQKRSKWSSILKIKQQQNIHLIKNRLHFFYWLQMFSPIFAVIFSHCIFCITTIKWINIFVQTIPSIEIIFLYKPFRLLWHVLGFFFLLLFKETLRPLQSETIIQTRVYRTNLEKSMCPLQENKGLNLYM